VALFQKDAVYKLESPGSQLTDVPNWASKLQHMGAQNTAYWPNYPTHLEKEVKYPPSEVRG
jgi:hypothetical protein